MIGSDEDDDDNDGSDTKKPLGGTVDEDSELGLLLSDAASVKKVEKVSIIFHFNFFKQ